MPTNPVPRRKPTGRKSVRKTTASKQSTQPPVTVTNKAAPASSPNTVTQLSKQVAMRDKEIAMLKQQVMRQEKKLSTIKNIAVQMAKISSRNNAVKTGQILDWGNSIMNTINGR